MIQHDVHDDVVDAFMNVTKSSEHADSKNVLLDTPNEMANRKAHFLNPKDLFSTRISS